MTISGNAELTRQLIAAFLAALPCLTREARDRGCIMSE
jgi:hypothetical protein